MCSLDLDPRVLLMGVSFPFICQEAPLMAEELCFVSSLQISR